MDQFAYRTVIHPARLAGRVCILATLFFFLPFLSHGAGVVVNEVFFDPEGSDTGLEVIELYNNSDASIDISGWQLNPDGIGYFAFPAGFSLGSKSFVAVHLRSSGANTGKDLYHSSASVKSNMGNTSGFTALFSGEPDKNMIKSFVQWGRGGQTWESSAAEAGLWAKDAFVSLPANQESRSISLAVDGVTGGSGSWRSGTILTLGASNSGSSISPPPPTGGSAPAPVPVPPPAGGYPSPQPSSSPDSPLISKISADAGSDQTATVGSEVHFGGSAGGLKKEPLDAARFWWNFGDGETREGKATFHIFRVPGTYIVGLHVSSGEHTASDYLTVRVLANQMRVARVVQGTEGYVQFLNPLNGEIDIGDWIIEDGTGKKFFVPSKTKVAAGAEISFSNAITGLLQTARNGVFEPYPLTVEYPNGVVAFTYVSVAPSTSSAIARGSVMTRSGSSLSGSSTGASEIVSGSGLKPVVKAARLSVKGNSSRPYPQREEEGYRELSSNQGNSDAADSQSATVWRGFSISSRVLFAGAVGLSVLGALGFFVLKRVLI